jgi:hypothetical protein
VPLAPDPDRQTSALAMPSDSAWPAEGGAKQCVARVQKGTDARLYTACFSIDFERGANEPYKTSLQYIRCNSPPSWRMCTVCGALATCSANYGANVEGFNRIHASKGVIAVWPAFPYGQGAGYTGAIRGITKITRIWRRGSFCRCSLSSSACIMRLGPAHPHGPYDEVTVWFQTSFAR